MVFLGFVVPGLLIILLVYCMAVGHAYAIGHVRIRRIEVHQVFEHQAELMMISYFCFALASFSYGYARHRSYLYGQHPKSGLG